MTVLLTMIHVHPNIQEVEQASALQRRLYRTIRETMRAMAGRICGGALIRQADNEEKSKFPVYTWIWGW